MFTVGVLYPIVICCIYTVIVCIRLVAYGNNISIRGLSALSFSANRAMRRPGHVGWARTESPRFSFFIGISDFFVPRFGRFYRENKEIESSVQNNMG